MVSNSTQTPPFVLSPFLSYPPSFTDPFQGRVDPFPAWEPKTPYDMSVTFPAVFYPNLLDYRNGYSKQWNFTIDQELTSDTKLSVSYVGMNGIGYWNMQPFNNARFIPGTDTRAAFRCRQFKTPTHGVPGRRITPKDCSLVRMPPGNRTPSRLPCRSATAAASPLWAATR